MSELDGVPRLSEAPRPTTNPRREKPHRPFDPDAEDGERDDDEKLEIDGEHEPTADDESALTEEQKRKRAEGRDVAPPDDEESGQILDVTA